MFKTSHDAENKGLLYIVFGIMGRKCEKLTNGGYMVLRPFKMFHCFLTIVTCLECTAYYHYACVGRIGTTFKINKMMSMSGN